MWFFQSTDNILGRFPPPFPLALALSVGFHLLLAGAWLRLPAREASAPPQAYQVRLVQAPPRPEARRIEISREAPTAPPVAAPAAGRVVKRPLVVPRADLPAAGPVPPPQARPERASAAETLALPLTAAPDLPRRQHAQPASAAPHAPSLLPAAPVPRAPALPPAPALPRPPEQLAAQKKGESPSIEPPPKLAPEELPGPPKHAEEEALESLRRIVAQQAPALPREARSQPEPPQADPLSELARRRYRSGIQARVRENHTYPADFPCGIEALVLITIARDGALVASDLLESSGNARYDYAVQLTLRATEFAPLPAELSGDTHQEKLRFTPKRCPSADPQ